MLLLPMPQAYNFFSLRIDAGDPAAVLARLKKTWHTLFPGYPFDAFFLDADFDR